MNRLPARWIPCLVLLGAQLAVGSAAILARTGLGAGVAALPLAAWRLTVASAALLAALRLSGRRQPGENYPLPRRVQGRLILAGVCLGFHFVTWFVSLEYISVARSTLLVATTPLWAGLAGRLFLRHRLPMTFWLGLGLSTVGVYLVTMGGEVSATARSPSPSSLYGDMMATLGAILVAAYLLLVQDLQTVTGTWRVVAWTYSAAALSLWPFTLFAGGWEAALPRSPAAWLAILGLAFVPQLLGHTAMNWSLRHFPAGAVAAATLLEPVFAAALAWWLFGEPLTGWQALGAVILLGGVGLALRRAGLPVIEESL